LFDSKKFLMRIALLSDIHGNIVALDAVLKDIQTIGGVDAYWVLGDLVAIGHAPVKVLERLSQLPNARFVRGNTDRYICSGDRPPPTLEQVKADIALLPKRIELEGDFAWTQGAVTISGWLDWLGALPLGFEETLPDGRRVLCVHASPNLDDGEGIRPTMPASRIEELVAGCEAGLICVGHTHIPFTIQVKGRYIINPGCVSNAVDGDVRASYALITANEQGFQVFHRRVDFDYLSVIEILRRIRHPAAEFIIRRLRGEVI
jgi:predicted phosphodiesterase